MNTKKLLSHKYTTLNGNYKQKCQNLTNPEMRLSRFFIGVSSGITWSIDRDENEPNP
jgi:hypothetical protein